MLFYYVECLLQELLLKMVLFAFEKNWKSCLCLRYKKNRVAKKSGLCWLHWVEFSQFCNETFHHSRCSDAGSGGISSLHEHRSDLNAYVGTPARGERSRFSFIAQRLSQMSRQIQFNLFRTESDLNWSEKKLLWGSVIPPWQLACF